MNENNIESIKQRCKWRVKSNRFGWLYGAPCPWRKGVDLMLNIETPYSVKEDELNTIGQYTSYKDKESNEVYEGDILLDENSNMCIVVYRDNTWMLDYMGQMYWYMRDTIIEECVVIGNIYDNPELLK